MPTALGVHSVNVFFAGNPIPDSPFGVRVGPPSNPGRVTASGRGLQPQGIRALETVDFKVRHHSVYTYTYIMKECKQLFF